MGSLPCQSVNVFGDLEAERGNAEHVLGRAKVVRTGFVQTLLDGDGHWQRRPILPNQLAAGVDLFGGV